MVRLPSPEAVLAELRRAQEHLSAAATDLLDMSRAAWMNGGPPADLHAAMVRVDALWLGVDELLKSLEGLDASWGEALTQARRRAAEPADERPVRRRRTAQDDASAARARSVAILRARVERMVDGPGPADGLAGDDAKVIYLQTPRPGTTPVPSAPPRLDILIVDDDARLARGLRRNLRHRHDVRLAHSRPEALAALAARVPDVLLCDYQLEHESTEDLLEQVAAEHPRVRRILYSFSRVEVWRDLLRRRLVHRVIPKSAPRAELLQAIGW